MYDPQHIAALRKDADLHQVDYSRATITADAEGGYLVRLKGPLFDLGEILRDIPRTLEARTAHYAEGLMLEWLIKIERAQRQRVRLGKVCGWSTADINHKPLTQTEVGEHIAAQAHHKAVAKLQRELQDLLKRNAESKARNAGADELSRRYGLGNVHKGSPSTKPRKQRASAAEE